MWATAIYHPEDAPETPVTEWTFDGPMTECRESVAPKLGKVDSLVSMDVDVPANANGVLYALAGFSGGLACYVMDGILSYEFNLFEIERTKIKAKNKLPAGKARIRGRIKLAGPIGGPMNVTMKVNGQVVAQGQVPAAMSLHFTSNDTFDIGAMSVRPFRSIISTRRPLHSTARSARQNLLPQEMSRDLLIVNVKLKNGAAFGLTSAAEA